jgi:hypothetical protein
MSRVCCSAKPFNHSLWIDTMNRCLLAPTRFKRVLNATFFVAACALFTWANLNFSSQALAQGVVRSFPEKAQRGNLVVGVAPEIKLNGKIDRLSPGARIRNVANALVLPAQLVGEELTVNYTRDAAGLVHEVWILSKLELADKKEQQRKGGGSGNVTFASESSPVVDDGKTPYKNLPRYKQP